MQRCNMTIFMGLTSQWLKIAKTVSFKSYAKILSKYLVKYLNFCAKCGQNNLCVNKTFCLIFKYVI